MWHRYSFSVAEKKLSLTLTEPQRHSYLLLRVLLFESLQDTDLLNTYHLKNVLFWACETLPPARWTRALLAQTTLYLLDRLIHCVARQTLPHYFIPENNLFRHIENDALGAVARKLVALRKRPLSSLGAFFSKYHFMAGPVSFDMGQLIRETVSKATGDVRMDENPGCPAGLSEAAFDSSSLDVAAAYVSDTPLTARLAAHLLRCQVHPPSAPHRALMVDNYTRRVLRPFLAAADVLRARCREDEVNVVYNRLCEFYKTAHDQEDSNRVPDEPSVEEETSNIGTCETQPRGTKEHPGTAGEGISPGEDNPPSPGDTKSVSEDEAISDHASRNRHLQAIAVRVPVLLPPVDSVMRDLEVLSRQGAAHTVPAGQFVLGLLYSYYLVITHHPSPLEAACHMHYLQEIAEYLRRGAFHFRYDRCARSLLSHALLANGLLGAVTTFLRARVGQGTLDGTAQTTGVLDKAETGDDEAPGAPVSPGFKEHDVKGRGASLFISA